MKTYTDNNRPLTWVSLILLSVLVIVGVVFLFIATYANKDIVARRSSAVLGLASLVRPGPGDTSSGAFFEGEIFFHMNDLTIRWIINYGASSMGVITAMDIIGPTLPADPLTGPVLVTLCGPPTTIACLSSGPNTLEQIISQTSPHGRPLNSFINAIVEDRARYKLRVKTQNFPGGALVSRLNTAF